MTLTADVVGDLHQVDRALTDLDPDSDIGSLSMSPASAEQVTLQVRTCSTGAGSTSPSDKGRAFAALGYPTWDAYVDARFGDFRITVPREHRAQAVATLAAEVRLSVRAIAKLLGIGVGTVHRELIKQQSGVPDGRPDDEKDDAATLGRDGKSYPCKRKPLDASCSCAVNGTISAPSNARGIKYAQGIGPHPDEAVDESDDDIPTRRPRDSAEGGEDQVGGSPGSEGSPSSVTDAAWRCQ